MNPDLQFIFARRSIRKYHAQEVPEPMVNDLLEAGMAAPSAVKKDPWHFIVVRRRETLDKMVKFMGHHSGKFINRIQGFKKPAANENIPGGQTKGINLR